MCSDSGPSGIGSAVLHLKVFAGLNITRILQARSRCCAGRSSYWSTLDDSLQGCRISEDIEVGSWVGVRIPSIGGSRSSKLCQTYEAIMEVDPGSIMQLL